jgi:RNA-directed DNA polymerase
LISKPAEQLWLPLDEGDCENLANCDEYPVEEEDLLERILDRVNLIRALQQVERNGGSPGIDNMPVKELRPYIKKCWRTIRALLINGTYHPKPVKRIEIPKAGGGKRNLGVPTVLDRFIQQAISQVLQKEWDPKFSSYSYGFRPGKNAHQAIDQCQRYIRQGYTWVVDIDLEKFFDRVNHDILMSRIRRYIKDARVLRLINLYLRSGVLISGTYHETPEGTPQGGPLSPLLANILLDGLDRELEKRGHRFVRYADDCNVYVRSQRAAERILVSLSLFLEKKLKLRINETKSAVGRPWHRQFLGFSFTRTLKRRLSEKTLKRFKERIRELTYRTRGRTVKAIIVELRRYLQGWYAYYKIVEIRGIMKELDSWIRRRLRCYLWKQWGRSGYRQLRNRGVSVSLAWNTAKSAHGPWRLSRSPALSIALPGRYFDSMGLPRLNVKST